MFIHLGGNRMISVNEVIAIIDATVNKDSFNSNPYFVSAEQDKWMEKVEGGETKSYVVTDYKIYASPISSLTLKKRAGLGQIISEGKKVRNRRK